MAKRHTLLVLGASGMLGSSVLRWFAENSSYNVVGTVRSLSSVRLIQNIVPAAKLVPVSSIENCDELMSLFAKVEPDVVINCIGIVKQLKENIDPLIAIPINSLLPHRLARMAQIVGARLLHVSTDCVFSGKKGGYLESDVPDPTDLYGRSKLLGEVNYPNAITLRTSIIGHELSGNRSLIDWFLAQEGQIEGYKKAIFSGIPTVELARIINDFVIPNTGLSGLYHLSAEPISKYQLLSLVAKVYKKNILIKENEIYAVDRSLNSDLFRNATGFFPLSWEEMINRMHEQH